MNGDNESERPVATVFDEVIARTLSKTYRNLSRRAFLSFMARKAMAFAGVVTAAQVLPFMVREARAQVQSTCKLEGRLCGGVCPGGGTLQLAWMACCPSAATGSGTCPYYTCCTYQDQCGAYPPGCSSIGSGYAWCSSGNYICTQYSCAGFYTDSTSCQAGCGTSGPAGTYIC